MSDTNNMRVKCTIEIDDESFSVETHGPAPEESVVGRAVAGALAAIAGVDGNMTLSFLLSNTIRAAADAPYVMRAGAQAWECHEMEPTNCEDWKLIVDPSIWSDTSAENSKRRDGAHWPDKGEVCRGRQEATN